MRLLIIQVGPHRIENFSLNQFKSLNNVFSNIDCARIMWKSDASLKSRNVSIIDDEGVDESINFVIDAEIEQPTNNSLKHVGCNEYIKWSRNAKESNFFVTATQFIYTRHLLQIAKSINQYDYVMKIRPDVIFFKKEIMFDKIEQIIALNNNNLYAAKNPHCHPTKQVSDHFFLGKFNIFDKIWPHNLSYSVLFNLSKYNPERLLRLRSILSRVKVDVVCERYVDYWNFDSKPRSYDPPVFQNVASKSMSLPCEILEYISKYA